MRRERRSVRLRRCARARAARSRCARALPQRCALCAAPCGDALVCARPARPRCRASPAACPVCALPAPAARSAARASRVRRRSRDASPRSSTRFRSIGCCRQFKYGGRLALADWAARRAGAAVASRRARRPRGRTAVVALPLAPSRQRERGFNQAREIARARRARGRRCRWRAPLARIARRHAAGGAAVDGARDATCAARLPCDGDVRGARIALVDDVMTTGATLAEAAAHAAARRRGARRVLGRRAHAAPWHG